MTTYRDIKVTCSVCGFVSVQQKVVSFETSGYIDLDTRPPEQERSAIRFEVQECPQCGYVAHSLTAPLGLDQALIYLFSPEYLDFSGLPDLPELALKFVKSALLGVKTQVYELAFICCLKAAWVCDDHSYVLGSVALREVTLAMYDLMQEKGSNGGLQLIRADLLRKTGQFDRLVQEYEKAHFKHGLQRMLLAAQLELARQKDTATYNCSDLPHILNRAGLNYAQNKDDSSLQNLKRARYLFTLAARDDLLEAQNNLGVMYHNGLGGRKNYRVAAFWYKKAALQNYLAAQINLGKIYDKGGYGLSQDAQQAVFWFRKAAEAGNSSAQFNLASCYASGWGVPQNFKLAFDWYTKAARQNDYKALNNLAGLYAHGRGTPKDYKKALSLYRKAARGGDSIAEYNIGLYYFTGRGVLKDMKKAATWLRKSALKENPDAQALLSRLYKKGLGVSQNQNTAQDWLAKAVANGYTPPPAKSQPIQG